MIRFCAFLKSGWPFFILLLIPNLAVVYSLRDAVWKIQDSNFEGCEIIACDMRRAGTERFFDMQLLECFTYAGASMIDAMNQMRNSPSKLHRMECK